MTLIQALKKNKPIRLKGHSFKSSYSGLWEIGTTTYHLKSFFDPEFLLSTIFLDKESILSNKWEVKDGRKVLR